MLSESPLDARPFFFFFFCLNLLILCKNLLNAHIYTGWKKPFLRPLRHMTFYNTLFNMKKSIQYFESSAKKVNVLFSLMGQCFAVSLESSCSLCLWDLLLQLFLSIWLSVGNWVQALCGYQNLRMLHYVKWHCTVSPPSLWILNPGTQPTGILSVVGLIC